MVGLRRRERAGEPEEWDPTMVQHTLEGKVLEATGIGRWAPCLVCCETIGEERKFVSNRHRVAVRSHSRSRSSRSRSSCRRSSSICFFHLIRGKACSLTKGIFQSKSFQSLVHVGGKEPTSEYLKAASAYFTDDLFGSSTQEGWKDNAM